MQINFPSKIGTAVKQVVDFLMVATIWSIGRSPSNLWSNGTTSVVKSDTGYFTLFHMNWGYGPKANNGWYDSESDYTATISGNFQYFQIVTYNIHP